MASTRSCAHWFRIQCGVTRFASTTAANAAIHPMRYHLVRIGATACLSWFGSSKLPKIKSPALKPHTGLMAPGPNSSALRQATWDRTAPRRLHPRQLPHHRPLGQRSRLPRLPQAARPGLRSLRPHLRFTDQPRNPHWRVHGLTRERRGYSNTSRLRLNSAPAINFSPRSNVTRTPFSLIANPSKYASVTC